MLKKGGSGVVPDNEQHDKENCPYCQSGKTTLLEDGFIRGILVLICHLTLLRKTHTISQPMSFVNG